MEDPDTGAARVVTLPCEECPRERLARDMDATPVGQVVQHALNLDWSLEAGFSAPFQDCAADEFYALQLIRYERNRFAEQRKQLDR